MDLGGQVSARICCHEGIGGRIIAEDRVTTEHFTCKYGTYAI